LNGKYIRGSSYCRILLKTKTLYKRKCDYKEPSSRRAEVATTGRKQQAKKPRGPKKEDLNKGKKLHVCHSSS